MEVIISQIVCNFKVFSASNEVQIPTQSRTILTKWLFDIPINCYNKTTSLKNMSNPFVNTTTYFI